VQRGGHLVQLSLGQLDPAGDERIAPGALHGL
jgi:hypothetical protein